MAAEPDNEANTVVAVGRCGDRQPYVPSIRVRCTGCREWCWMSKQMKADIPKNALPVCSLCMPDLMVKVALSGGSFTPQIPEPVMEEFRQYMEKIKSADDN